MTRGPITQCEKGNWCSHAGEDYLCQECRPARSDSDLLTQRVLEALDPVLALAEELEEANYRFGIEAARRKKTTTTTTTGGIC